MNHLIKLTIFFILFSNNIAKGQSPGGISLNNKLWLRSNNGVSATGTTVTEWQENSGANVTGNFNVRGLTASSNMQSGPTLIPSGVNFNPYVSFDGVTNSLSGANDFLGTALVSNSNVTVFQVLNLKSGIVWLKWETDDDGAIARLGFENSGGGLRFDFPRASPATAGQNIGVTNILNKHTLSTAYANATTSVNRLNGADDNIISIPGPGNFGNVSTKIVIGNNDLIDLPCRIDIAEVIIYSNTLTSAERNKIESYLAVKYGFTLNQAAANNNNYVATNAAITWDRALNSAYANDITGIGRDDATDLNQKQSKSINTTALVTLYNGTYGTGVFPFSNSTNTNNFSNNFSFLLVGDNGGVSTVSQCVLDGKAESMQRVWKASNIGSVSPITIAVDQASVPATVKSILVSTNPTFPLSGTTIYPVTAIGGKLYSTVAINHNDYFTFATDTLPLPQLQASAACTNTGGSATVLNPVPGAVYNWYNQAAGGILVATGTSIALPNLVNDTTLYVQTTSPLGCVLLVRVPVTIILTNNLTLTVHADTTICSGDSFNANTVSNGTPFTWSPVAGVSNPAIASPVLSPTQTTTYTVTAGTGTCIAVRTFTVTVLPAVSVSAGPGSTTVQTICINTAVTNITYTIAGGGTGATVTGLPAGVTGSFAGGVFTISGTATATGTFAYTVTTTGGCSTATASGTITVNTDVTIALSSGAATAAQNLCINTAITNITYATTNGATGAIVTGLPVGVTGSFAGSVFTISGTPTVAGTFSYTVTTTGGCSTATATGTITVNPAATILLSSAAATAAQTVCINTAITNITYTIANGATGATVTGLPAGVTGSFAGGVFTISGTPTASGAFSYTVTTSGGCGIVPISGAITVNANVTLVLTSAAATVNQTVCINTAIANIVYTSANGATAATVTGLPAGVIGSFAAGVFTISGSPTVTGIFNYTVTTTGGCSLATQSGSIIVNPNATIALSSAAATTAQTLCINTAITNITYTVANGGTGATVTGLPAGVTGNFAGGAFTISGSPTLAGSFSFTVSTTGGCSSANLTGIITVVAYPNKPIVRSPVFYCPGDAPRPLSDSVTGTNLLWYTTATGGIGSSTPPPINTSTPGITSYYVSQSNGNCEGPRDTIRVNVNNRLAISIGIDSTICEGDSVKYFPVVTPAASFYQWRAIGVPNTTIDSVNIKNATFFPVNNAQYILRAGVGGCASEDTVNINVRWKPIVDAGKNVPICI
ncbi:MAG: beta strand repeat-containing protein, partial [Ferruginibacter sp.]